MVKKCYVPGCKSNYNSTKKDNAYRYISVFSFPRNNDLKRSWLTAISRTDHIPSIHSGVCEFHFDEKDILNYDKFLQTDGTIQPTLMKRRRLKENAVPKFFPHDPVDKLHHVKEEVYDPANDALYIEDVKNYESQEMEFHYTDIAENLIKEEKVDDSNELLLQIGTKELCFLSEEMDKIEFSPTFEMKEAHTHEIFNSNSFKNICNICGESFTETLDLRAHVEVHVRGFDFRCMICGEDFIDEQACVIHVQEWHSDGNLTSCSKRPNISSGNTELGSHVLTHESNDIFGDMSESEMTNEKIHKNESKKYRHKYKKSSRLYPCRICGKTFPNKISCQIHIRKHTGERPFTCSFCQKPFRDSGSLRKHERIHTGEKPYACVVCSKAFNQRILLRNHIKSCHSTPHDKNRSSKTPYSCSICTDMFNTSQELIDHLITHCDMNTLTKMSSESSQRKYRSIIGLMPCGSEELD